MTVERDLSVKYREELVLSSETRAMGKLDYFSYVWKCVAAAEILYALCLGGSFVLERSSKGTELHHTLFETLPGFVWIDAGSVILGAFYMLVFSILFGSYMVWMHNSSIQE